MARIRTIKPSFWGDVAPLSRDARLLMAAIMSMADDDGRFIASPSAIVGYAYPHDSISHARVRNWLAEIVKHSQSATSSVPRLHLYTVDGLEYGVLLNYRKHQRISHPQPSPLPPPQGELFRT